MDAAERVKKALEDAGKTRESASPTFTTVDAGEGRTQRVRACAMIELPAADVVELCDAVAEPDDVAKALRRGAAASTHPTVVIEAHQAFAVIDQAAQPKKRQAHKETKEEKA